MAMITSALHSGEVTMTQFITALVAIVRNCALDILNSVPVDLKPPAQAE